MVFTTQSNERLAFKNALVNLMSTPGLSKMAVQGAVLTQSYLRTIQPLNNSSTNFSFQILANQTGSGNPIRPDERRLNQQDAFYLSKIWVYIFKGASATDMAVVPKSYPNPVTFPTGAASLYTFYNGRISLVINNNIQVPGYPLQKFLQIPQTQLTAATNSPSDQYDGTMIMPWEPNLTLVGLYNNEFSITIPANIATIDANTFAAIEIEGVLAQNVALGAA
jgi:hypothetical protein